MRHSPADIEVILHFNSSTERHPRQDAPAVANAINGYLTDDILRPSGVHPSGLDITERGRAWVEMICDTPYPEQVWLDPRTKQASA